MRLLSGVTLSLASAQSLPAGIIEIDYSYDSSGVFTSNTAARTALEQAASDIGSVITSSLGAISEGQSASIQGSSGGTVIDYDWTISFKNLSTGLTVDLDTFSIAADTIRIYAGGRSLTGSVLGQGGPGSAGYLVSSSNVFESNWIAANNAASVASDAVMLRGGEAPVLGTLTSSWEAGSTSADRIVSYAPLSAICGLTTTRIILAKRMILRRCRIIGTLITRRLWSWGNLISTRWRCTRCCMRSGLARRIVGMSW
ncbi:MAG: hypothetical protein J6386_09020 [Candidatus Synoicihabitans palmerolidicus]|nr:hypothetical protein [Candidatus Synoicihabitans palmerolidicus]